MGHGHGHGRAAKLKARAKGRGCSLLLLLVHVAATEAQNALEREGATTHMQTACERRAVKTTPTPDTRQLSAIICYSQRIQLAQQPCCSHVCTVRSA
jgi:hypothetical protein